jgi:putative copper resistance protein D
MSWFGAEIDGPMIVTRTIHFAASAITAGVLIFGTLVAEPALRSAPAARAIVMAQILRVAWVSLAVTVASGVIWVLLQAEAMSELPLREAMSGDILSTVLTETQFGMVSEFRLVLAIVLAACLFLNRLRLTHSLALISGLGLVAGIAWTGHAGSGADDWSNLHLTADVLHLVAAAAWLGGLVPLTLLLSQALRNEADPWASLASQAARRFSMLGIVSVGTITATGIVNGWILVGSFKALVVTEYGRLLMLKISLFAVMLVYAAINRFWLTPDLALPSDNEARLKAMRRLTRNSGIEIALGLIIFAIVGMLGTLHPAAHFAN